MSAGLFREMLTGMDFVANKKNTNKIDKETPILFLSGEKDPVGEQGKGVIRAYKSFEKAGIKDISLKLYKDLRHDILHEDTRTQIFEDIYNWILEKNNKES